MIRNFQFAVRAAAVFTAVALSITPRLSHAGNRPVQRSRPLPSDAEIRKILSERVGAADSRLGIVVGIIEPQGKRIISYGHRNAGDPRPLDGDTVYEMGSVTKVFTALLLAQMAQEKEVALTDPVAKYLPEGIKVPERSGKSITLLDLATHTSGLPFMPENAPPFNDPAAAKYSAGDLKQYVTSYQLARDIGSKWEYSNIGYWVLSEALVSRSGRNFEDLVRTRLLAPLKMTSTGFALSAKQKTNLAVGHDSAMQPTPEISTLPVYSIMPAAGGLYSTANDLLTLLSVAMRYERSPLAPAIDLTVSMRRPTGGGSEQALGWTVLGQGDDEIIFRDGGTVGYASAVAWEPKKRIGVVVLLNQVGSVDDIARHLLRPDFPLAKPVGTKHTEIALDAKVLDSYAGQYEAKDEGIFTITRESDFLTIESPAEWGLPKLRLRPESQRDFFTAELPLRVTFKTESDGRVSGLLIYPPRGQKAVPADRM